MRTLTCDELRANAAEMALGILSGAERADALDHMEHCVSCRTLVEGLAQTGDSLLLLAPEADPPIGFEASVAALLADPQPIGPVPSATADEGAEAPIARFPFETASNGDDSPSGAAKPPVARRPRRRWVRPAVAVAAAMGLVGGTAAAVTLFDQGGQRGDGNVEVAQPALHSGQFKAADGRPVGHVVAYNGYNGNPSWVLMNVDASGANGTYTCEVVLSSGTAVPVGQFMVHDGIGEWAHTVSVDVKSIKAAELVGPSGATLATATVS
jgi:hypothetical protein